MPTKPKFNIIGDGIAGLSVAAGLQKFGIDFALYEAVPQFKAIGAGIILSPNALYVYDQFGLYDALVAAGHPLPRFDITDAHGKLIQGNETSFSMHGKSYTSIGIHRGELQRILVEHLPAQKIHLNHALKAFDPATQTLTFCNDTTIQADAILACDGIHSVVRQTLFPEVKLRYSGQTCWRGVADFKAADLPSPSEMWGCGVRFGFVPISSPSTGSGRGEKVYWYATDVQPAGGLDSDHDSTRQTLLKQFDGFAPHVAALIKATPKFMRHDLYDYPSLNKWHVGNTLLIGDAAHAMTPNMGQGAAQSIEDAWAITNCLAHHDTIPQSYAAYEKWRMKKAHRVSNMSWQIGRITNPRNRTICAIRNRVMALTPPSVATKQRAALFSVPAE